MGLNQAFIRIFEREVQALETGLNHLVQTEAALGSVSGLAILWSDTNYLITRIRKRLEEARKRLALAQSMETGE